MEWLWIVGIPIGGGLLGYGIAHLITCFVNYWRDREDDHDNLTGDEIVHDEIAERLDGQ